MNSHNKLGQIHGRDYTFPDCYAQYLKLQSFFFPTRYFCVEAYVLESVECRGKNHLLLVWGFVLSALEIKELEYRHSGGRLEVIGLLTKEKLAAQTLQDIFSVICQIAIWV